MQISPFPCLCPEHTGRQIGRYVALERASRRRMYSEEDLAIKQIHELDVMQHARFDALPDGQDPAYLAARQSLAVARATQQTTWAKREVMIHREAEAALRRQILRELAHMVANRIKLADRQLGGLLHHMNTHGLRSFSPGLSPTSSNKCVRKRLCRMRGHGRSASSDGSSSEMESSTSGGGSSSSVSSKIPISSHG